MSLEQPQHAPVAPRRRGALRQIQEGPVYARYAGFVSRAVAMVIDLLIVTLILTMTAIATSFFVQTSGITQLIAFLEQYASWIETLAAFFSSPAFEVIVVLTVTFGYFTFFYSFGGATLGKYLMGLRVVTFEGRRLKPTQAALRSLAYALSSLALYLGFLAVLVDDRRRGWHDRLARTVVVYKWQARPDEAFLREIADELD